MNIPLPFLILGVVEPELPGTMTPGPPPLLTDDDIELVLGDMELGLTDGDTELGICDGDTDKLPSADPTDGLTTEGDIEEPTTDGDVDGLTVDGDVERLLADRDASADAALGLNDALFDVGLVLNELATLGLCEPATLGLCEPATLGLCEPATLGLVDALSDSAATDDALGVADCEPIDNPTIEATPEVAILGDNAVLVAPLAFREAVGADQMLAD